MTFRDLQSRVLHGGWVGGPNEMLILDMWEMIQNYKTYVDATNGSSSITAFFVQKQRELEQSAVFELNLARSRFDRIRGEIGDRL